MFTFVRRLAPLALLGGAGVAGTQLVTAGLEVPSTDEVWHKDHRPPPSRRMQLEALRTGTFDVLVIGGVFPFSRMERTTRVGWLLRHRMRPLRNCMFLLLGVG